MGMNDEMTFEFPTTDAAGQFVEELAECNAALSHRVVRVSDFESQDASHIRSAARKLGAREVRT
jgi:hypothetical protein